MVVREEPPGTMVMRVTAADQVSRIIPVAVSRVGGLMMLRMAQLAQKVPVEVARTRKGTDGRPTNPQLLPVMRMILPGTISNVSKSGNDKKSVKTGKVEAHTRVVTRKETTLLHRLSPMTTMTEDRMPITKVSVKLNYIVLLTLFAAIVFSFYKYNSFARMRELDTSCIDCGMPSCKNIYSFHISYVYHSGLWGGKWIGEAFPGAEDHLQETACSAIRNLSTEFKKIPEECLRSTVSRIILAGKLQSADETRKYLGFCLNDSKSIVIDARNSRGARHVFFHEFAHLIVNSGHMAVADKNLWKSLASSPEHFISQKAMNEIDEDIAETLAFVIDKGEFTFSDNEVLSKKVEIATRVKRSWCPQMR